MSDPILRPPLPPHLSHEGIAFALDESLMSYPLSDETLAAIATSLQLLLPSGDFTVGADGVLISGAKAIHQPSLWYQAGLLDGIERSSL